MSPERRQTLYSNWKLQSNPQIEVWALAQSHHRSSFRRLLGFERARIGYCWFTVELFPTMLPYCKRMKQIEGLGLVRSWYLHQLDRIKGSISIATRLRPRKHVNSEADAVPLAFDICSFRSIETWSGSRSIHCLQHYISHQSSLGVKVGFQRRVYSSILITFFTCRLRTWLFPMLCYVCLYIYLYILILYRRGGHGAWVFGFLCL